MRCKPTLHDLPLLTEVTLDLKSVWCRECGTSTDFTGQPFRVIWLGHKFLDEGVHGMTRAVPADIRHCSKCGMPFNYLWHPCSESALAEELFANVPDIIEVGSEPKRINENICLS